MSPAQEAHPEDGRAHRLGRPSTPRLSVDKIGHEALALLEEEGFLSLPRLAERLGVRQSAFYKHVSSRADIVELARGALSERVVLGPLSGDLPTLVTQVFDTLRTTYQSVPALLPLILVQPVTNLKVLAIYDRIAQALLAAGIPDRFILPAIEAIDSAAIGAAQDMQTMENALKVPDPNAMEFPHLLRAQTATAQERIDRFDFLARTLAAGLTATAMPTATGRPPADAS
ncbi:MULTISPECIES: TetR family transcriptional regulator [Arthrobacter]|uniref:TetR family transcriptional regulator n=2 Tax=Arthrobacter TaxID=1663 RepID=A0ABU9KFW4_9MICC|nr:TetR family transcriptional regulator [Arthrobacter sp. YJM1]MDP5225687.1 TetR family transcriptional regulator [Arthrobacter sp. YJM1]